MSRKPFGEAAMSVAERSRRKREKAKALRDAVPMPDVVGVQGNGSEPMAAIGAEVFPDHDYPRMLYYPDGRTTIATTPEAHEQLALEGWAIAPLAVHRQRQATVHGALGTNPMTAMIREAIREVFAEYDLSSGGHGR